MPIPSDWAQRLRNLVENWTSGDDQELLGTTSFDKFILTERANSWADFVAWLGELRGSWCFRGQRDENWILDTSLDRAVKKADGSGYYHLDRRTAANDLLFRFQQQAHQYIQEIPSPRDVCSWFAIMQHHGVPTMFLDWTSSPYVAMYFAFEEEPPETGCALWAVDLDWLENTAHELLPAKHTCSLSDAPEDLFSTQERKIYEFDRFLDDADQLNNVVRKEKQAVVLKVDPLRLHARMVAQQGFFLCNLYDGAAFSLALMRMMMKPLSLETPERPVVRKLVLKNTLRFEFLRNLRKMNIHRASLFPGLDGFGRSMRLDLEMRGRGPESTSADSQQKT